MSEVLNKLAACERVSEWLDPWDERLVIATGETPPNSGATVREVWRAGHETQTMIARLVSRLLVPSSIKIEGTLDIGFEELRGYASSQGTVVLDFSAKADWVHCFPVSEQTQIFKTADGLQAWAGLALCDKLLGLAVFSCETETDGLQARIQPVPDKVFQKIVSA